MSEAPPTISLTVRLGASLALVVSLILALFGAAEVARIGATEQQRLDAAANAALNRMTSSLPGPLWDFNTKSVVDILRGEMAEPLISGIRVAGTDDQIIAHIARDPNGELDVGDASPSAPISRLVVTRELLHHDGNGDQHVGKLILAMDDTYTARAQHNALVRIVTGAITLDVVMVLLLSMLIHRSVIRPIHAITQPLKRMAAGDSQQRVQWESADEFGMMARAVNDFIDAERNRVELESALKAKSDFLAVMSHEIRTPLNGVLGLSQALAKTPLADAQQTMLRSILVSGELLLSIVNNILDFSKLEAGKFELESVPTDVGELCRTVAETFLLKCREKNIQLFVDTDLSVAAHFPLDVAKLRQVLMNLIGNAIKFTHKGSVTVSARHTNGNLQFCVADTGIGMADTDMKKLFHSFSQIDASTTRKYGGTGLGLAISQGFVTLMQGTIAVTTEPECGSTFTVSLPVLPIDETPEAYPANIHDRRTLLLTANTQYAQIVRCLAMEFSRNVTTISDDGEVLMLPEPLPYDVVFLDTDTLMLDDMTLPIVPSWIKSNTIVIASSLSPTQTTMSELREVGVTKFISGYVTRHQIIEAFTAQDRHTNGARDQSHETTILRGRVLLVDDIAMNRSVVRALLAEHELTLDEADNGYAALEFLSKNKYDVVLMDCHMPGMDGFQTTLRFRAEEARQIKNMRTPIVALTASTGEDRKQSCFRAGMDAFVSKPFRESELLAILAQYLAAIKKERPPSREASATSSPNEQIENSDDPLSKLKLTMGTSFDAQIRKMLDGTQAKLREITAAITANDANTIYQHAHSLKGSWGMLGAMEVHRLSEELERQAKAGNLTGAAALHTNIAAAVAAFEQRIIAHLDEKPPMEKVKD